MKRVDLHCHTIYSDGSKTPEELIHMCQEKNITTFAITDHDNIEGSKLLIQNHPDDMTVYSGVELTIKVPKGRMHMLGYNFDLNNKDLNEYLINNKKTSIYNVLLYIEIIKKDYGIIITNEEIERMINKPGNVGRPEIAALLVLKGICKNIDEAFDRYLTPAYIKASKVKKGITPEEGIQYIRNAGGIPVLAHPNSLLLDNNELDTTIKKLTEIGLGGIESTHINENSQERKYYHYLAQKYHLLETGGTDYHGDAKPDVELGTGRNHNIDIKEKQLTFTKRIKPRYK